MDKALLGWRRKQLSLAKSTSGWISADDAEKIKAFKGGRNADFSSALDWLNLACSKVFKSTLVVASSLTLRPAQGRAPATNPRHSNKSNFAMGPRELPPVAVVACRYPFDPLTVFEFVSLARD